MTPPQPLLRGFSPGVALQLCVVAVMLLASRHDSIAARRVAPPRIQLNVPDSMRVAVVSVPDPVAITLPTITTQPTRDWFDWLGLLGALLVAPIAAYLAAQRGAELGAVGARQAAIEVQEREAADARRLRADELRADQVRERALLLRRLERDLTTTGGIADGLRAARQFTPIMPVAAAHLRAMWDSFVRRRDAVMLLGDPDLEHEIEFFYEWAFSRSHFLEEWLSEEQVLLGVANPDAAAIQLRAGVGEQDVRAHVERMQAAVPRLRTRIAERDAVPPVS